MSAKHKEIRGLLLRLRLLEEKGVDSLMEDLKGSDEDDLHGHMVVLRYLVWFTEWVAGPLSVVRHVPLVGWFLMVPVLMVLVPLFVVLFMFYLMAVPLYPTPAED